MKDIQLLGIDDKVFSSALFADSVFSVCKARGVTLPKLVNGTGIFLDDPATNRLLSVSQLLRLLSNAQRLTPTEDCGFQIGHKIAQKIDLASLNIPSHPMNIGDVIKYLEPYQLCLSPFLSTSRFSDGNHVFFALQHRFCCGNLFSFLLEIMCTTISALSKKLCGERLDLRFLLPYPEKKQSAHYGSNGYYTHQYQANLGTKVFFSQPLALIGCQQSDLDKMVSVSNRIPNKIPSSHTQPSFPLVSPFESIPNGISLLDAIRDLIRTCNKNHEAVSLNHIAQQLALSPATLKRKLKQQHTHFKQLHDEVQMQDAIYYMVIKGFTNEQIAREMAFSDPTNFRRSVKRWTGYTPQQLRREWLV